MAGAQNEIIGNGSVSVGKNIDFLKLDSFPSFQDARNEFEKNYLMNLLTLTQGNVSRAARFAKRNRTEFYRLLNRHEIKPARFKEIFK